MVKIGRFAAILKIFDRGLHDRAESVAIMVTLMLPIFMAASGLVIDAGYYRYRVRVLQSASDSAALAAARDCVAGLNTAVQIWTTADTEAVKNGFMDGNYGWNPPGTTSTPKGRARTCSPQPRTGRQAAGGRIPESGWWSHLSWEVRLLRRTILRGRIPGQINC